ncbi:DUF805 domain-containing protein [Mucilaginibacter pedocola]|uniref:DUF805 domain-containing protein n=1 Tax=Mucilaginibacter pedocola TaxID=1792845 RepID=A0A1S9P8S3_9SPHI|nr:DUF805 domain-containing protein [Mucilaginibacter pedocola]OOQ57237.1 hypothetical protein BC343_14055 [Mucilaginibacter pedocola]
MFNNPFVFFGRIRRKEYGYSLLIYGVILIWVIAQASHNHDIYMVALLPLFWFRLAQGAKRCHDLGNSGWFQIIPFYSFWMLLADGETGPNRYGENPKGNNWPFYPGNPPGSKNHFGPTGPTNSKY